MIELPYIADIVIAASEVSSLEIAGVSIKTENAALVLSVGKFNCSTRTALVGTLRNLRIIMDTSALEIFANDGETVLTTRWYPTDEKRQLAVCGKGEATIYGLHPMRIEKHR